MMLLWVMSTTKLRFDSSVHQFHQVSVFWLVFPKDNEFFPKQRSFSSFFNSCSERERISPYVGPSSMFIIILGEHWKERGRADTEKRFKGNYCHPTQWLPNSCCCLSLHYFSTGEVWSFLLYYYLLVTTITSPTLIKKWKYIHKNIDMVAFHSALQNGRVVNRAVSSIMCRGRCL